MSNSPVDAGYPQRLVTLVNGDVVGYSRMMASDPDATIRGLEEAREHIAAGVRRNGGRLVDFTGDNFLAEFDNASPALRFALSLQGAQEEANRALPDERRLRFRLGMHVGDVRVDKGGRLYGDGVNVAARLESLAPPGGICASRAVRERAADVEALVWEDLGRRPVKNIPQPVHVYRVRRADGPVVAVVAPPLPERGTPLSVLSGRPAIAVLPFENMSSDSEQEYFADGITEDLLTRLASQRIFPVIARNSTFVYKGRAVDPRQIGRELGARYVVEGSVRRAGGRVRTTAQLIDATSGHHVWAECYDRDLGDVFALQDEITEAIAKAMHPEMIRSETDRVLHAEPASLDAWDCVLRGYWCANLSTLERNADARVFFAQAIALDPSFPRAYCGMVMTHFMDALFLMSTERAWHRQEAVLHACRAAQLAPDDPEVRIALGNAARLEGRNAEAIAEYERAVALSPNLAVAHSNLGSLLALAGRSEPAIAHLESALRLSPKDPWVWAFHLDIGTAHVAAGRHEEAIAHIERSLAARRDWVNSWALLAAARAHAGRPDDAREAVAELKRRAPQITLAVVRMAITDVSPALGEAVATGLERAGLE